MAYDVVTSQMTANLTSFDLNDTVTFANTTMTSSSSDVDDKSELQRAQMVTIYARFYMLGVIIPLGLFFNTFAFVVFLRSPNIRRTTTGRFLIALTIADTVYLIGDFLRWLNSHDVNKQILGLEFMEVSFLACTTIYFLRFFGQLASSWLTVAITFERFVVVAFPLRAQRISTVTKSSIMIASTYVISIALTLFPYWTLMVLQDGDVLWCGYRNQQVFDRWNWIVLRMLSLVVPSIVIFIFTGLIIFILKRTAADRHAMANTAVKGKRQALERQLTLMLVAVAVTFLVLRLPYMISFYLHDYRETIWGSDVIAADPWLVHRLRSTRDIFDAIATANYAINFFLYCLTGSQFRSNMAACIRWRKVTTYRGVHSNNDTTRVTRVPTSSSQSTMSLSTVKKAKKDNSSFQRLQ